MRRAGRIAIVLLIAATLAVSGIFIWGQKTFQRPGQLATEATVIVPRGAGLQRIATLLAEAGVIDRPLVFIVAARLKEQHLDLKAGEYAFAPGVSPAEALAQLREGRVVVHRLTVPEGLTSAQVARLLADTEGLIHDLKDIPAEGILLPETYDFIRDDRSSVLVDRMATAHARKLAALWQDRADGLPFSTPEEARVLASIVEKETGIAAERPRIAGVFINRLRRGMRLQSDPSVVYAVSAGAGPLGRPLTLADLRIDNPYNTYKVSGLPPGPIANAGAAALAAVLQPAATDELYFVADGTGGHAFATTLREHNRNVAKWRRINRQTEPATDATDSTGN
ncbi:MAG: endolytic transglycosylase MltG [Proteobacteria bacterium]|nr:endolytic transglycosylase MltG [Pseudomonadota bacterium]